MNVDVIVDNFEIFIWLFCKVVVCVGIYFVKLVFGLGFGVLYYNEDCFLDVEVVVVRIVLMIEVLKVEVVFV